MITLQQVTKSAQQQANRYGYDYVIYRNENGLAFARKSEFERDWQANAKIKTVNPN